MPNNTTDTTNTTNTTDNKEIPLLKAHISILKTKISNIEKENESLRMEKSKLVLNKFEMEKEIKKKLETQFKEQRISVNQRKILKRDSGIDEEEPSPGFILKQCLDIGSSNVVDTSTDVATSNDTNIAITNNNLIDTLQHLKFFRDYFFNDFYNLPDHKAMEILEMCQRHSPGYFLNAYSLFCCKKNVFQHFSEYVFENNSFLELKIEILENVPSDWIVELANTTLKRFLEQNRSRIQHVAMNVAESDPSHLNLIFPKSEFDRLLVSDSLVGRRILQAVAQKKIPGYIDEKNMHLVPEKILMVFYGEEYNDCYRQ